ncbi:nucleoside triphosphate pyrophosphohydrolase [Deinococcus aquaedulcis]|uniref:nucleoside triphosphate pyrophosphohydrolase n=1 Tax=Deinococcus aquaedulcis TaxID=2840455 RepID=UPI001C83F16B|nr:nucleoside triphosphate pyrophosphohydrolase [Deinococcus aquaedulcis]
MPKLVRDRIPELFGGQATPLPEAAFRAALHEKLQEEVTEYLESGEVEELADVLEVIFALAELDGLTPAELEKARAAKAQARGAFVRRLWWTPT